MRKFVATAVSAAMLAGSVSTVVLAEEASMASSSDVFAITVTAEGESLEAGFVTSHSEDGNTALSAYAVLPASMLGTEEPLTLTLEDLAVVADGDLYLNVDAVLGLYQEMTGDASLVALTTMVGITEPWIAIPKLEIGETATEELTLSEDLAAALAGCAAGVEIVETETGVSIAFNDDTVIGAVTGFEMVAENFEEELNALMTSGSEVDIDVKTVFADYILAVAEGMAAVDTTTTVDAYVEYLNMMIDMVMEEAASSAEFSLNTETTENGETVSLAETVEAALETVDVDGVISIEQTETELAVVVDVDVTEVESGETVNVLVSLTSTMDGEFYEITAPESATLLRDVVKNGVTIYMSMMAAQEETYTE